MLVGKRVLTSMKNSITRFVTGQITKMYKDTIKMCPFIVGEINMDTMHKTKLSIINFLDIENEMELVKSLKKTSFGVENEKKFIKRLHKSKKDRIPQFYFLYDDNKLIGYFFLEKRGFKRESWISIDNIDELSKEQALYFLDFQIKVFQKFGIEKGVFNAEEIKKEREQ